MAERLGGLPDLQVVQVLSAGIDWVEPHVPEHVTLCNAGDTRSPAVAQWVVAAILADLIGFQRAEAAQLALLGALAAARARRQARGDRRLRLDRARGRAAAGAVRRALRPRRAAARAGASSRSSGSREAVEGADVVVVLAPLSDETRGLVGAEVIARMPDGALLVNAGRGPVVDTDALVEAVRAGRIRAALDVTDPEPLPDDHVAVDARRRLPHAAQRGRHAGGRARRAGARARADPAPPRGPAAGHVVRRGAAGP